MRRTVVAIDAPSNLGLKPPRPGHAPGVAGMAGALRAAGIVGRLGAVDVGTVAPLPYSHEIDPETRVRNAAAIRDYTVTLADRLERQLAPGRFPLVLGGDCSIVLGPLLALRRRGTYGLVYLDGHTDFLGPATSPSGGAAGMDLALACGRGPDLLTDIEGRRPLVQERNVVALGFRDPRDRAIFETAALAYDLEGLRRTGLPLVVTHTLERLGGHGVDGFWIHVDVDVLDSEVMAAVDSPQPDGLSYAELVALLRPLMASERAVGLQLCIYNPELDPDGWMARELVGAIGEAFA